MGQVSVSAPRSTVSTVHVLPVLESSGGSFTLVTRGGHLGEDLILRTVGQPIARTLRVLSEVENQRLGELGIVRWT